MRLSIDAPLGHSEHGDTAVPGAGLGCRRDDQGATRYGDSAEANALGYVDDFRFMAIICFASIGLLFFLKKSQRKMGEVPVH